MKKRVNGALLDEGGATLWFLAMLHHSLVMTVSGRRAEFSDVGVAVLQMLGRNRDVIIGDDDARDIHAGMRRLPPHADVVPALQRLQRAGFKLVTLTTLRRRVSRRSWPTPGLTRTSSAS
ncbi:MAG: hypothetical protein ABIQ60_11945 [Burkholderiaceae bacterium]